jgi:hypothetical protein
MDLAMREIGFDNISITQLWELIFGSNFGEHLVVREE